TVCDGTLGGRNDGLRLAIQVIQQNPNSCAVEFGIEVIYQENWVLFKRLMVHGHLRQIKNQQRAALLAGTSKTRDFVPVSQDFQVIPMRPNQAVPDRYLIL